MTPLGARSTDVEIFGWRLEPDRPDGLELYEGLTLSPPDQAFMRNRSGSKARFRLSMK